VVVVRNRRAQTASRRSVFVALVGVDRLRLSAEAADDTLSMTVRSSADRF
jgi:hypothetical protein